MTTAADLLAGIHIPSFTPVPLERRRATGWTPERQRRFIAALAISGSIGTALRAVGMKKVSAYRLRARPGAESFAAAWDDALFQGRNRLYDVIMDRTLNGVTTVTVSPGGKINVSSGLDAVHVRSALGNAAVGAARSRGLAQS
jgi:hypothetical protein